MNKKLKFNKIWILIGLVSLIFLIIILVVFVPVGKNTSGTPLQSSCLSTKQGYEQTGSVCSDCVSRTCYECVGETGNKPLIWETTCYCKFPKQSDIPLSGGCR